MTTPVPTEGPGAGGPHKPVQPDAPKTPFAGGS